MTLIRRFILAAVLMAGFAPAIAQVPAPVPALPDTERRSSYVISGTTCACNVNFALYGDSTDYQNWVEVFINGVRYDFNDASHGWTITTPSGSLGTLARPITNAVLTFNAVQTGTVQIVGARRPRRASQFNENAGVSARNLNQVFTDIISQNREIWDKTNDMTGRGLFSQPGNTLGLLPLPATCKGTLLGFDGTTGLTPICVSNLGSGNVTLPVVNNDLACFDGTNGMLKDCGVSPDFKSLGIATKADIATTTVSATVSILRTSGYATVGDNGGANYTRIAPSTPAAWRAQSADGQWWALNSNPVTPEMFGAFSGVDDTAAFAQLATWLQTAVAGGIVNGGVTVNFKSGADYQIWPTTSTPGFSAIGLINVSGITFNFNGARISTSNTWAHGNANVFFISGSNNLIFNGPSYVATDSSCATIDATKCGLFFQVAEAVAPWTSNIQINNAVQNGGSAFFLVSGADGSGAPVGQQKNISIINADLTSVFYGMNFAGGGDNVFARGIKGINIGRLYFPYNVSNHDVELIGSTGGAGFVHALLKVYANPASTEQKRTLSNIKVRYKAVDVTSTGAIPVGLDMQQSVAQVTVTGAANNGGGLIRLTVNSTTSMATGQTWYVNSVGGVPNATGSWTVTVIDATHVDLQASTFGGAYTAGGYMRVPAYMRNIDIKVDLASTVAQPPAFATFKENSDGTTDTTTSGYTMVDVSFGGTIRNYDYGIEAISLFRTGSYSLGTWVGETVRNFTLSDLIITGTNSSVLIDASNVLDPGLILDNIYSTPTTVPWTITGINANTKIRNVSATNVTDRNTVVPSTAGAGQFATGISNQGVISYGTPNGYATVVGTGVGDTNYTILSTDRYVYINANFTAARTWTLPAANAVPAGTTIWVQDARNTVTSANTLTIQRAGADAINTALTSIVVNNAKGGIALVSDGVSNWGSPVQNVATGGTGLIAGTSGGLPCFNSATTMLSSVALTANAIMLGGGAGACPSPLGSLGTTTTVLHGNAAGAPTFGAVSNSDLTNSSTTVAGQTCTLGSTCGLSTASNVLGADVLLNNTANFFDGPSMAQGTSGTWFASGSVTLNSSGADFVACKLWDGTTVISSGNQPVSAGATYVMTLTGILASPAANIRISCKDSSSTNGKILFNTSGASKDASIYGFRIN